MAARNWEVVQRAERLLARLEELRAQGRNVYPPTLGRLFEDVTPEASSEQRMAAIKNAAFKQRTVVVQKGDPRFPVALVEDLEALAASPTLLEQLLEMVCTPAKRAWEPGKLKAKLFALPAKITAELRQAFERAVRKRIEEGSLPETIEVFREKEKTALCFKRLPPEPTPVQLAETLLTTLERLRGQGASVYPTTLPQLIAATGVETLADVWQKATARKEFKSRVLQAVKKEPESPLAFAGDLARLAGDGRVLALTMKREQLASSRVASLVDLAKHLVPALRKTFQQAVHRLLSREALPAEIAVVWHKTTPLLFPAAHGSTRVAQREERSPDETEAKPQAPVEEAAFVRAFDEAFGRLDRLGGSNNFVSLVDLRRAMPGFARERFDGGLRQLRQAGRYSLRAAEGFQLISVEERDAGIIEDGALLLYVTRKRP